jgi:hypothetical protein
MPDLVTVKKPPDYKLTVGSPGENYVALEITATNAMKKLQAQIAIPCGDMTAAKAHLCADGRRANLIPRSEPVDKLRFLKQEVKETLVSWKSNDFSLNAGEKVTIKIAGFNPERHGEASLQLRIGNPTPLHEESYTISIAPAQGPTIVYFDVSPTNVPQQGEVTISSTTTGAKTVKLYANETEVEPAKTVTLYANGTEVEPVKPSDTKETLTVNKYTHAPQRDTTYHLMAWQSKPEGHDAADAIAGTLAQRKATVSVTARPGWYSWDLLANSLEQGSVGQHFYPTLLLNGNDLSGESDTDGDTLYGIFVCQETRQAGLWSSRSGVDGWSFLGNVPDGMAESPGVIHNRALWLVGGSSADPLGHISNRVCWYYKNEDKQMVWKEWDEEGSERKLSKTPVPRRCHACAVFNGKVWVLGGLSSQNNALDDVWTCSADPANGKFTLAWEPSHPLPSGRCLSVTTATPVSGRMRIDQPRLWLCGGATHPYNLNETFYDLWWTQDGKAWEPFKLPKKLGEKIQVLAATLLYDNRDELLHLAGIFRIPEQGSVTSDYELADTTVEDNWGQGSLVQFGWDFPTDLFLIRSVCFRERWIFSPVYQDRAEVKRSNARIYFTPV